MLDSYGYFERGHDRYGGEMNVYGVWIPRFKYGTFVWSPAPAVAIILIEELSQDRQKRNHLTHLLGVPRLLWSKWRWNIYKSSDLIIEIPTRSV